MIDPVPEDELEVQEIEPDLYLEMSEATANLLEGRLGGTPPKG